MSINGMSLKQDVSQRITKSFIMTIKETFYLIFYHKTFRTHCADEDERDSFVGIPMESQR